MAEWWKYVSLNKAITGSDNGMLPVCQQAIIWINDDVLSIRLLGNNFIQI